MSGKPAAPEPHGRPAARRQEAEDPLGQQADAQRDPPAERSGPLTIERLRKDDGRALILYSVDADEQRDEPDRGEAPYPNTDDGPPA